MTAPFPAPVVGLAWHVDAACRKLVDAGEAPADTWDDHVDGERPVERLVRLLDAQAACAGCPVAQQCLDDHLSGYGGGVRGGYVFEDDSDYKARAELIARDPLPREPATCGTPRGARAHKYRAEDVCDPCAAALRAEYAARAREYRRQRREARQRQREDTPA